MFFVSSLGCMLIDTPTDRLWRGIAAVRSEDDGLRKLAERHFTTPDKPKPDINY